MRQEVDELLINGQRASEFTIHAYTAGMLGVPVVFVSGDAELCAQAQAFLPAITAVPVSAGEGGAAVSQHPDVAVATIRNEMERALRGDLNACRVALPPRFHIRVRYAAHPVAYRNAFYPGARQLDEKTIVFESDDYYEVLRLFQVVL
jgi:D-amino peptidase